MPSPSSSSVPLAERLAWVPDRWPREERRLVAVSGGLDSVVLLHLLVSEFFYRDLCVVHLDHGLRGDDSVADAEFVEGLAKSLGLDFLRGRVDVRALAKELTLSVETAAREARHSFFGQAASAEGCDGVWVAHHGDDQAETILLQVLRGAGSALGMADETRIGELRFLRPLLGVRREELRAYAEEEGLEWREDASNTDPAHARNRIRHELLPLASEILGRDVTAPLVKGARVRRADDDFLELWATRALAEARRPAAADTPPGLAVEAVDPLPIAVQRRVLRSWLADESVPDLGFDLIEKIRMLLPSAGLEGAKVNLPGDRFCRRRAGLLFVDAGAV